MEKGEKGDKKKGEEKGGEKRSETAEGKGATENGEGVQQKSEQQGIESENGERKVLGIKKLKAEDRICIVRDAGASVGRLARWEFI